MKKSYTESQGFGVGGLVILALVAFAVGGIIYYANFQVTSLTTACKTHCATLNLNYTLSDTMYGGRCVCESNTVLVAFNHEYSYTCIRKVDDWYQCGIQQMAVIG